MLLGVFTLSTPLSFVSCKDYDKDIERIDKTDKELTTQLSTLQTALTATTAEAEAAKAAAAEAKAEALAAKAVGDAAALAAAEAKAQAQLALQAAAQAKADAIAFATKEIEKLMEKTATKEELNALGSKIEGIQKDLNSLTTEVDNLKKFDEAVKIQIAALEKFQALVTTELSEISSNISGLTQDIANLKKDLQELKDNMATKADLEKAILEASQKIEKTLGGRIDTLIGVLINRLTSVTLIPTVYVDGIPSIDFKSVQYTPKKFENGKIVPKSSTIKDVFVSNGKTVAKYRLNPTGVGMEDIEKPSFVEDIAEIRSSRSTEKTIIDVESYDIVDGQMIVNAKKADGFTGPFELGENKINIVALKVPNKNLMQGETAADAMVYSEYVRLTETTFTPQIAAAPYTCPTPANHYSDSITIYSSMIDKAIDFEVNYEKGADLNEMVTGCYVIGSDHKAITIEELKSYGLEFQFQVAKGAYNLGSPVADQQTFATIDSNGKLTSKIPAGITDYEVAVGKQPIVRVVLKDTKNGNLVDQKYIKVRFSRERQPSIDLGVFEMPAQQLGCKNIKLSLSWQQMTTLVYAKLNNGDGISKEDFANTYTQFETTGTGSAISFTSSTTASPSAIEWTLTPENIGTIVPETSKDYTIKMTYKDPKNLDGDVILTFKVKINVTLPGIGGYYENYWSTVRSIFPVKPIHYNTPEASATCKYATDLWTGFNVKDYNGTILKNLSTECGTWDLQFAMTGQLAGFKPAYTGAEPSNSATGYSLVKTGATNAAATLAWPTNHTAWAGIPTNAFTKITLDKNNGGKELVGKKIKVGIWAKINAWNTYEVTKYDLDIVVPVTINNTMTDAEFYDGVISGSVASCAKAFTMTDFNGYTVAEVTTDFTTEKKKYAAELYKYYEVLAPTWDTNNAKIGMKKVNGDIVVDDALTAANSIPLSDAYAVASITKNGNDLVFKNNGGTSVTQPCNIFIKATVTYGWGTAEEWVKIRLYPAK